MPSALDRRVCAGRGLPAWVHWLAAPARLPAPLDLGQRTPPRHLGRCLYQHGGPTGYVILGLSPPENYGDILATPPREHLATAPFRAPCNDGRVRTPACR